MSNHGIDLFVKINTSLLKIVLLFVITRGPADLFLGAPPPPLNKNILVLDYNLQTKNNPEIVSSPVGSLCHTPGVVRHPSYAIRHVSSHRK